jgi:Domain of unknown function (DUF4340)
MTRHQLIRIAAVLAVALVVWGALAVARRPAEDRAAGLALPRIDTAGVDTITLTEGRDTATLARPARGQWRVNGYPADSAAIASLLEGFVDTARWSELVAESRTSHPRLGVGPDSGRRVRVVSKGRTLLDLTTGKRTAGADGIYVRRTAADPVYAMHGTLAAPLARELDEWRDKRIASVEPESVATIEVARGPTSYTLRRSGNVWKFASGRPADSAAVANLLGEYRALTATDFATPAQAESTTFTRPRRRARLLASGGAPLVSLRFDSTASGAWARADSGGPVFRLDTWTLNQLAPAESTLRVKK